MSNYEAKGAATILNRKHVDQRSTSGAHDSSSYMWRDLGAFTSILI